MNLFSYLRKLSWDNMETINISLVAKSNSSNKISKIVNLRDFNMENSDVDSNLRSLNDPPADQQVLKSRIRIIRFDTMFKTIEKCLFSEPTKCDGRTYLPRYPDATTEYFDTESN